MTETGSDLTPELASRYGIYIVPMHVTFGDKTVDDMSFHPEKIREYYKETGKLPTTSGSVPEDFTIVLDEIHEKYPEAQILLMSPHFTSGMNFGKDKAGEKGGTLAEYAAMVVKVAEEMDVDVLDNFKELGIKEKNWLQYLPDGTHPNERARYLFGSRIIEKIEFEEKGK